MREKERGGSKRAGGKEGGKEAKRRGIERGQQSLPHRGEARKRKGERERSGGLTSIIAADLDRESNGARTRSVFRLLEVVRGVGRF